MAAPNRNDTWAVLNKVLKKAGEQTCLKMLEKELTGPNRLLWKKRLYQRYSKLRREREHKRFLKVSTSESTEVHND